MKNEPGFSMERERPFKEGPPTKVVSVAEARSLKSPASTARVPTTPSLSVAYLAFSEAFGFGIFQIERERESYRWRLKRIFEKDRINRVISGGGYEGNTTSRRQKHKHSVDSLFKTF